LKLKDLHQKIRREQEGYDYEEEYYEEVKKPKKRDDKKRKGSGGYFGLGMTEFTEVPGGAENDEDYEIDEGKSSKPKAEETEDDKFKNISNEKLSDICIGNFKEYLETQEYAFDTFKLALKSGVSRSQIVFGVFEKLFDLEDEKVKKFDQYLLALIDELKISKTDMNEGLNKYNTELVLLECDYVFVDKQYSKIIYELMLKDLFDFDQLLWYNEEEQTSDIFIKIMIRIVEHKFIASEHDEDETKEFVKTFKIAETLKRISEFLLEEDLVKSYQAEIFAHRTIYALLGLSISDE